MEPVEINGGSWYLRAQHPDEWAAGSGCSWAVCEPTTGIVVADVTLDPQRGVISASARPGHDDAATRRACESAYESVRRFAESLHHTDDTADPGPTGAG